MTFKEFFESELKKHGLNWCHGCAAARGHKRGFVLGRDKKTVHLDSSLSQRRSLHRGLHEIGHCVNDESGMLSWQKEQAAEEFATKTMREAGIRVPRELVQRGVDYVNRKKRHGDNIRAGRLK